MKTKPLSQRHAGIASQMIIFVIQSISTPSAIAMVEGPGATRNASKVQQLLGYRTQIPSGQNVVLKSAFSVGKQVFLVWDNDRATRLHFGMNGSLGFSRRSGGFYSKEKPSLVMTFRKEENEKSLVCYSTTIVHDLPATHALASKQRLEGLDACAPDDVFDRIHVLEVIQSNPSRQLTDVLLDQSIFPGVGNIIKIEGLHRARLHPQLAVQQCAETQLRNLINECRQYARDWLRNGRAPRKLVYNQSICQTCSGTSIRMAKLGQGLARTTFWCEICQPINPNVSRPNTSINTTSLVAKSDGRHAIEKENLNTVGNPYSSTNCGDVLSCPRHGLKTTRLRRVRKKSDNEGRLFVLCPQCPQYFKWADDHLACQKCHHKPVRRLRISKTLHSGGRWFLSCQGCKSFAWAQPPDLKPLQAKLTPLL